jgi:hypothetical protein
VKHRITLELDHFSRETIGAQAQRHELSLGGLLRQAVHYYLADRDSGRVAWRYPRFRRDTPPAGDPLEVEVELDDATWAQLEAEAGAQDVALARLLEHAALYFVADLNSGRVTARILDAG